MAKSKEQIKLRKKVWVQIVSPKMFNNELIGESYVYEPANLQNRSITINLMTLTRDIKKQNTNATFMVNEVKDGYAYTKLIGFERIPASIRRLVRRRRNKIENSIVLKSKDLVKFRIKPLVITANAISSSVEKVIRKMVLDALAEYAKNVEFEQLLFDMLENKFQKNLKDVITKIAPIKVVEIRIIKQILK